MNLSFQRLDAVRALIMVLMFVLAMITTGAAALQMRNLSAAKAAVDQTPDIKKPMPRIVVSNVPMGQREYQAIADRLRVLYPEIIANATERAILISGNTAESYLSWRLALSETLPHSGSSQWNLKSFCAGSCDGAYFRAEISVNKVAVEVIG